MAAPDYYPYSEIIRQDPDGKTQEPTEADYQSFREWVVTTWGEVTWRIYNS